MAAPPQTQGFNDLFHHAEERAERLIAILRLFISATLTLIVIFLVLKVEIDLGPVFQRQIFHAILVMVSYFVLGIVFLAWGVLALLSNLIVRNIVGGHSMWSDIPAQFQHLPSQLLSGFLTPLDIFAIVLAAIGAALLAFFFLYKYRLAQS